eukprot:gene30507-39313_t
MIGHRDIETFVFDEPVDGEVIVYCACPNEASAAMVAKQLMRRGYRRVRPLSGGIDAWIEAGHSRLFFAENFMFRLSLDALLILDAIDRRGSFSAAGVELHRVPSTISYTVSKLEQDLGVQVFERQGPKVQLTRAGAELLKEGRYLLKAAEDLEHRVRRV